MPDYSEFAWAPFYTHGQPVPNIYIGGVARTRRSARESLGKIYAHAGETPMQGWKRAYRIGWRIVRVIVDLAPYQGANYD